MPVNRTKKSIQIPNVNKYIFANTYTVHTYINFYVLTYLLNANE